MPQTSDFWRRTVWAPGWYDEARRRRKAATAILSDEALRALMAPDTPSPQPLEATGGEEDQDQQGIAQQ
jgi:hypothetical protein